MTMQDNTVIHPIPNDELLLEKERKWKLVLPADYRKFIVNYNGGIPNEKSFECNKHNYAIVRFLCILKNVQETQNGWYDISVVESQIGERLTDGKLYATDFWGRKFNVDIKNGKLISVKIVR